MARQMGWKVFITNIVFISPGFNYHFCTLFACWNKIHSCKERIVTQVMIVRRSFFSSPPTLPLPIDLAFSNHFGLLDKNECLNWKGWHWVKGKFLRSVFELLAWGDRGEGEEINPSFIIYIDVDFLKRQICFRKIQPLPFFGGFTSWSLDRCKITLGWNSLVQKWCLSMTIYLLILYLYTSWGTWRCPG